MDASDKPTSTLVHSECRCDESLHYLALARLEATVVLRRLLDRTTAIDIADVGRWLPSLLVRRLEKLELTVGIAG
jgi:hypothetical protein